MELWRDYVIAFAPLTPLGGLPAISLLETWEKMPRYLGKDAEILEKRCRDTWEKTPRYPGKDAEISEKRCRDIWEKTAGIPEELWIL